MAFEHVEGHDVLRRETLDYRTADAVFFLGELASEELLAPFSRDDGGVIRMLDERNAFIRCELWILATTHGRGRAAVSSLLRLCTSSTVSSLAG